MGQGCLISDAACVSGETSQYPTGSHVSQLGVLGWQDPPTTAGFKGLAGQPVAGLSWGFNYMPSQHKLLDRGTTQLITGDRNPQVWSLGRTLPGTPGSSQTNVTSNKRSLYEVHTWPALSPGAPTIIPPIGTGGLEAPLTPAEVDLLMPDSHTYQPFIHPPCIRPTCLHIFSTVTSSVNKRIQTVSQIILSSA